MKAEGGVEADPSGGWDAVGAAGLDTSVVEPLERWTLQLAADEASFDLELRALGAPAELDERDPAARAGGMTRLRAALPRDGDGARSATTG